MVHDSMFRLIQAQLNYTPTLISPSSLLRRNVKNDCYDLEKGTSIFSEQLPGNFFLNVVIMGIVASLASVAVIAFNDCLSRQKFQAFTFFLAGFACILCSIFQAVIPEQTILIVSFGILAKFAAQSEFLKKLLIIVVVQWF